MGKLPPVLPSGAIHYTADLRWGYIEAFRKLLVFAAGLPETLHLLAIRRRDFYPAIFAKNSPVVVAILFAGNPLKIVHPVVLDVSVYMVHLWLSLRVRDKCCCNKAVHTNGQPAPVTMPAIETNHAIPMLVHPGKSMLFPFHLTGKLNNLPTPSDRVGDKVVYGPDTPFIRHLIITILHSFIDNFLPHRDSLVMPCNKCTCGVAPCQ